MKSSTAIVRVESAFGPLKWCFLVLKSGIPKRSELSFRHYYIFFKFCQVVLDNVLKLH